jgi:hypothetical protein
MGTTSIVGGRPNAVREGKEGDILTFHLPQIWLKNPMLNNNNL